MANWSSCNSKPTFRQVLLSAVFLLFSAVTNAADSATGSTTDFATNYVAIPGNQFASVLSGPDLKDKAKVKPFAMRISPVTNGEYQQFLQTHPEWRRDSVPSIFADASYLHTWSSPNEPGDAQKLTQAATSVSWHAAQAYCETENARLPAWYEWELVAAADGQHADARSDPAWLAHILSWYSVSSDQSSTNSTNIGHAPNYYGIKDMHGLIWEWVSDFNALLISADSRTQGDPDKLQFCGAGAISLQNKENYAILMRVALLSSLTGASTTDNLGFRCARDLNGERK
ncbi:formylglycine-generating enzyme family protein [Undibacterium sp. Ji83W]|uniref:formylglycine-generating enzyme family protein n=1 Tax=Undibacterium sp. Ji83W TaxID=3413043 RepID=UPI003BF24AE8